MAGVDRPTKETAHRVEEIPGLGRRIGPAVATGDDVRASNRNPGRLHVGTPGRIKSESACKRISRNARHQFTGLRVACSNPPRIKESGFATRGAMSC